MKVYVGNLSKQITNAELNTLAAEYGTVATAEVASERSSGDSKGFGFLEYDSDEEGRAAITGLNGREVNGQILKADEAKPRKDGAAR
jgi:cold-inducible RNA-binding protein